LSPWNTRIQDRVCDDDELVRLAAHIVALRENLPNRIMADGGESSPKQHLSK
jgi:hypothetical protein